MTFTEYVDQILAEGGRRYDAVELFAAWHGRPTWPVTRVNPSGATRRTTLTAADRSTIVEMWKTPWVTAHDIANQFGVSVDTVYRTIRRAA